MNEFANLMRFIICDIRPWPTIIILLFCTYVVCSQLLLCVWNICKEKIMFPKFLNLTPYTFLYSIYASFSFVFIAASYVSLFFFTFELIFHFLLLLFTFAHVFYFLFHYRSLTVASSVHPSVHPNNSPFLVCSALHVSCLAIFLFVCFLCSHGHLTGVSYLFLYLRICVSV